MRLSTATDATLQRHKYAADGDVGLPGSAHHRNSLRLVSVHARSQTDGSTNSKRSALTLHV